MKFEIIKEQRTPAVIKFNDYSNYTKANKELIEYFLLFVKMLKNCVGLAANQVSKDGERLMEYMFAIKDSSGAFGIVINPIIVGKYGIKESKYEACLTWPGKIIFVERYSHIKVSYIDIKGDFIHQNLSGYTAQVFQHEVDHLNGIEEKFVTKTQPRKVETTGRNELCLCGSRKKFKNCCLIR